MIFFGLVMFFYLRKKMKSNLKFFKGCKSQTVDKFFQKVLYDKKFGYYSSNNFWKKRRFCYLSNNIEIIFWNDSNLIISTWEKLGKPKNLKIVELGPGDGSMAKVIVDVFKKFPSFDSKKMFFYMKQVVF